MNATIKMFRASLKSLLRDRQSVVGALMFPLIFLLAFSAFDITLFGDSLGTGDGGVDYIDFVLAGILSMAALQFSVFWTSGSYARMGETGVLRRLQATPISRASFLAGQVLARLIVVAVQSAVVIGAGVLLGATITGNVVWVITLAVIASAVFLSLGFAIGARASGVDAAGMMSGMVVMPLVFLSGAWFPIDTLPGWLQTSVEWLPLAPLMDAMREIALQGASLFDVAGDLLVVAAWVPVMFVIAAAAMRPRTGKVRGDVEELRPAEATA